MALNAPTVEDVVGRLDEMGIDASREEAATMRELVAETLETYERVDELPEPDVRRPRDHTTREYHGPADPEEDPLGAWLRRCHVEGTGSGLLADKTVALKDNVSLAGVPISFGTDLLEHVPTSDATIVTRMLEEGATITGITDMDGFAFSGVGDTGGHGPTFNPHDPDRYAGGSSSGSAAAVSAGDVDIAIGGDQGGSIRIPAAWSGCVGHKPTHGLVPYTGVLRVDNTIDHTGPLAGTVADAASCLESIAGTDSVDPRQRDIEGDAYTDGLEEGVDNLTIGIVEEGFGLDASESAVDEAVRAAMDEFADLGATVESVSIPEHADALPIWLPIIVHGAAATLAANGEGHGWRGRYDTDLVTALGQAQEANPDDLPYNVAVVALLHDYLTDQRHGEFYAKSQNLRRSFSRAYEEALTEVDLLAMPTTPMRAFEHDPDRSPADTFRHALAPTLNTCAFDTTGHPSVSVPCAKRDGLPVGLMLTGQQFDDATVLQAAHAFESATDWESR